MKNIMKNRILGFLRFIFLEKIFIKKLFLNILADNLKDSQTILELGAGKDSYLKKIKGPRKTAAIDIHSPALQIAREHNVHDWYIKSDVRDLRKIIKPQSFDAVVAFDLIEHLTKTEGYKLIENMCRVSRKKVIIYTPNGFLPQPAIDGNPFQKHLSGWEFAEMKQMGFKVYGMNGFRQLRGSFALPKLRPYVFGLFISNLSWLLLKMIGKDNLSFSILCIKDIHNKK